MLKTDNGGEFTSTQFENFLKIERIQHERTIPKTPQQNRVAKRLNRTLVEISRSMLLDAKLSKKLWAESVAMAVYLRNCCPSKAVMGKTPYEAWFGQKLMVDHLSLWVWSIHPCSKSRAKKAGLKSKEMCSPGVWRYNKRLSALRSRKE